MNIKSRPWFRVTALFAAPLLTLTATPAAARHPAPQILRAQVTHTDPSTSGPFVSLLFSRSEMTAADNCTPDDASIARLDTTVAPYLQSLGMAATGTLETGITSTTAQGCTHFGDSLTARWADAQNLATNYGWTFGSATATYPTAKQLANLTPAQSYAQTCGTVQTITAHGLPGANGIIDYPGAQASPTALQTTYGQNCFAWARQYTKTGVTDSTAGSTAPYWQNTEAVMGGPCNDPAAACYTGTAQGSKRYTNPAAVIAQINALQPGQWFTLQAYLLVTGTSPVYGSNGTQWDCTSADPADHWTNDVERYCWSDYQAILQAIAARAQAQTLTVTDPLTVGEAFGRPATYSSTPPIQHVVLLDMENHDLENLFGFPCAQGVLAGCPASVNMPASVTLADGTTVTPSVLPDTVPNVLHNPKWQIDGMNNQWDLITGCSAATTPAYACIGGYTAAQEPNMIALAQRYAWSAMTFSNLTASWGSHLFTAAPTMDGFTGNNPVPAGGSVPPGPGWGCDSNDVSLWQGQYVPSCVPDPALPLANGGAFEPTPVPYVPTIFDELDAAGTSWNIYGAGNPGGGVNTKAGGYKWSVCPTFAECLHTSQVNHLVPTAQFFTDAAAGSLPGYSVITPASGYSIDSEHNLQSMTAGDNFLGQIASAVQNSPDWGSTVLLITWDDFGGFYANPSPVPGHNPDHTRQGFRAPMLIISPYTVPGYVDTTPAGQVSATALVEQVFGLSPLGVNDQNAYAYSNALCIPPACTQPPTAPARMVKRPLPASARHLGNAGAFDGS